MHRQPKTDFDSPGPRVPEVAVTLVLYGVAALFMPLKFAKHPFKGFVHFS